MLLKYLFITTAIIFMSLGKSLAVDNPKGNDSTAGKKLIQLPKLEHAEPLYNDFTTPLGARRGEGEINVLTSYISRIGAPKTWLTQAEFEYAPINRLGIEVDVPFAKYYPHKNENPLTPSSQIAGIQWAAQYTFLVSEKTGISMAVHFTNAYDFQLLASTNKKYMTQGVHYNPELVFAKNIDDKWFVTATTGPYIYHSNLTNSTTTAYTINAMLHYKFGYMNYVGAEWNTYFVKGQTEVLIHPEIIFQPATHFSFGFAVGVPFGNHMENADVLARLILHR